MNALIYLATAVLCAVYAVRAWVGGPRERTRRSFAVLGVIASLTFGSFGLYLATGSPGFRYLHAGAGTFLPPAILLFLDRLLGRGGLQGHDSAATPWVGRSWAAAAIAVTLFYLLDGVFVGLDSHSSPGELVLAMLVQAGFLLCLWRLWRAHEATQQHVEKVRLRYLLGLLTASACFSGFEQLLRWLGRAEVAAGIMDWGLLDRSVLLQGAIPPVGVVLATLFLYFLHQVVELSRLLDLHEIFARIFTLAVMSLVLVGVDTLTVIQRDALAQYPTHGAFQVFLASALFLSVYDPLRRRIEALAGEWFNRPGRRLDVTLIEVDRALSRVITLDSLGDQLLGRLYASGRAPLASLYLWDPQRGTFHLSMHRGLVEQPLMPTIAGTPFADAFRAGQRAYLRSELDRIVQRRDAGHEEAASRLRTLDAMDADLSLSIRSGDLVLGWLNLKAEAWMDGFSKDEVRRLGDTVDRVAILIENLSSFEQVKEQHRLAALGTMAAGLAHEIRNPLAGIKGAAQYLQDVSDEADPEEVVDFAGVITQEVDRLGGVVTQFLDYARPLSIRAESTHLGTLAARSLELVRRQDLPETVSFELVAADDLPEIEVDPDKLHQVLLNLIQNAIQALDGPGHIRIEVARARARRSHGSGPPRPTVEIRVVDDGPGIAPADQENLFIPFFTTRHDGTGLGLAISRRLVEAQGGELLVRSRPGHGATFVVQLPVPEEPVAVAR